MDERNGGASPLLSSGLNMGNVPVFPIIRTDSVLRQLPVGLDRKQALFLDGIRHAAEIMSLAYSRLTTTLTRIAQSDPDRPDLSSDITSSFFGCLVARGCS